MSQALLNHVAASSINKKMPVLKAGHTVRVHQRIKEGDKERIQMFEGLVIRVGAGEGVNKTFTVRRIVDGIGVEKTYPFFSPFIDQVEVIKAGRVRRSKLYFMRERTGKSARLKEVPVGELDYFGFEAPEETPEAEAEEVAEDTQVEAAEQTEAPAETAEAAPEVEEAKTEETEEKEA